MICDGAKVASLREKRTLTQFELAAKSRVDPRTVQRMEAGESVSGDTLKNVAAELGVLQHDLLRNPVAIDGDGADGTGILLKPERSGRRLVEAILAADHLDFGVAFEPWPKQVEVVQPLLKLLEEMHPLTFTSIHDYDSSVEKSAARRLEVAAQVNEGIARLVDLQPEGLHVLFGQYTRWDKRVRWDNDEGVWFTHIRQREEVLTVAALRIAPLSTMSLRIPIQGNPVPAGPSWDTPKGGNLDDEIPF